MWRNSHIFNCFPPTVFQDINCNGVLECLDGNDDSCGFGSVVQVDVATEDVYIIGVTGVISSEVGIFTLKATCTNEQKWTIGNSLKKKYSSRKQIRTGGAYAYDFFIIMYLTFLLSRTCLSLSPYLMQRKRSWQTKQNHSSIWGALTQFSLSHMAHDDYSSSNKIATMTTTIVKQFSIQTQTDHRSGLHISPPLLF